MYEPFGDITKKKKDITKKSNVIFAGFYIDILEWLEVYVVSI